MADRHLLLCDIFGYIKFFSAHWTPSIYTPTFTSTDESIRRASFLILSYYFVFFFFFYFLMFHGFLEILLRIVSSKKLYIYLRQNLDIY